MTPRRVNAKAVVQELLARHTAGESAALAFDGDGTLWSGDVGEDVFRFATEHGLLREASDRALVELARAHDVAPSGSPSRTARAMFDAYLAGHFPEPTVCEMMTWCYAGFSLAELAELVQEVFRHTHFATRLRGELSHILESARAASIRTVVVSASPRPIVEIAAHAWGFAAPDIAASTARVTNGVIDAAMDGALPYAQEKCRAARALFGEARWLASFGDNAFDVEMFQAADLAVAVHPKPALLARLGELAELVLLDDETA